MKTDLTDHLSKLVSFYPVTTDQARVTTALEYALAELKGSGLFKNAQILEHNGISSLYASTRATKTPKLLLLAHIDVVAAGPELTRLKVNGDKLIGRGVYDMLFAVAAYLKMADDLSGHDNLDLAIMLVGDEEVGGFNGAGYLASLGYIPQICILPDAGEGLHQLNISHRGVMSLEVSAKGRSHHASRPWEGDGAANKLVQALNQITLLSDNSQAAPFTVVTTKLQSGDSTNKGPDLATAHLDIRYMPKCDAAALKKKIVNILASHGGRISSEVIEPSVQLDPNYPAVKEFVRLQQKHAAKPIRFTHTSGASDARFFSTLGIPIIMLRPKGGNAHGDNEWIDAVELESFYELLKEYVQKVARIY